MPELRPPRYLKPMNRVMMAVQRLGIPTGPAMVLTVRGRKSGRLRSTPMTPFEFEGGLYVVAGYPGADWAANARAAGAGTLSRAGGHGKSGSSSSPPAKPGRCCGNSPPKSPSECRSRNDRGWCGMERLTNSKHWRGGWPSSASSRRNGRLLGRLKEKAPQRFRPPPPAAGPQSAAMGRARPTSRSRARVAVALGQGSQLAQRECARAATFGDHHSGPQAFRAGRLDGVARAHPATGHARHAAMASASGAIVHRSGSCVQAPRGC